MSPAAHRAFIGLGANLGDPVAALREAARRLHALPGTRVVAASSVWRSAPVDAAGPDFANAVAEIATTASPVDLLGHLREIERAHGRERPFRNAPRTLDLDLLLYDALRFESEVLTVPHPRMHTRRFVLAPLVEIAPDIDVPGRGVAHALLAATASQPVERTPLALCTAKDRA